MNREFSLISGENMSEGEARRARDAREDNAERVYVSRKLWATRSLRVPPNVLLAPAKAILWKWIVW